MDANYYLPIGFGWYGIAYSDDIKAGEVKNLFYVGQPLVVFRTESGSVVATEPFCPHLGAHLGVGGKVVGEHIQCPFHAWEFDQSGICQKIPYAKQIPPAVRDKSSVYCFPTEEKNGVIWIWYHPKKIPPMFDVVDVPELSSDEWSDYECFEFNINSSVQETAENAADAAHFQFVHGAKDVPTGKVVHDKHLRNATFVSLAPAIDENGNIDDTGTHWTESHLDTSNNGPGQTWQRFQGLVDVVMLGLVTPVDAHNIHLRFAFKRLKGMSPTENFITDCFIQEATRQVQEDIPIWENKRYNPSPVLCDGDGPIGQFRKWFRQFYIEEEIVNSDLIQL